MRIAYVDCVAGASGDMLLAALVDAGASEEAIYQAIEALNLSDCGIQFQRTTRRGLDTLQAHVRTSPFKSPRQLKDLIAIIKNAALPPTIQEKAINIIHQMAQVEAKIHNSDIDSVHLHELGGDDTLIDIVSVLTGFHDLQVEQVYVSPLPLSRGWVASEHGLLPLPAPATLAILKNVPVNYIDIEAELVTPTGAALLTSLADGFGGFPPMRLERVGIGCGRRELAFPNILRIWLGESESAAPGLIIERLTMLETNIDDMNPQLYEFVMQRLFQAGVLDVTFTPIQMKKNRPGIEMRILCNPENVDTALSILFNETSTLGVRRLSVERLSLPRSIKKVDTIYGSIRIKISTWGEKEHLTPEYDDCRQAAIDFGAPLHQVIEAARQAFLSN